MFTSTPASVLLAFTAVDEATRDETATIFSTVIDRIKSIGHQA